MKIEVNMKSKTKLLFLMLFAILVSACGSSTPTAAPAVESTSTTAPTEAPVTSGDPVWDRVQAAGKIVFGTSADYQPFEYYDASYEIIGFDAALARELAARLGLEVELVDIAFEGLPAALQIGQIDAAIAAISVTPERQATMDFTNVYYAGEDAILAREASGIPMIAVPAQLAQYRVGAQRGSIYATWVQQSLVDTGLMSQTNLLLYDKAEEAVRDLRENRNDLVIMDKLAADEYILAGGVVSVGQSLNKQLFAIALPKGATTLQAELNLALTALQNDGTIARLMDEFLDLQTPAATPVPVMTAVPGPTATPAGCYDGMAYVQDVQVPDGTEMKPGQEFDKVWRIRNTGTCAWNNNYQLVFVQGDRMNGNSTPVTEKVNPGNVYDMTVKLKAPNSPGRYTGIWQMVNLKGIPFGERIWVKITVPGAVTPTAAQPTATSVPPVQPTSAPAPVIEYLRVSSDSVQQGDVLVVSWSFSGESLASARLTRTNPDGTLTPLYGGADVSPHGEYEDLMMDPGTYSYTLTVSSEFGGTTVQTVVVNVTSN